MLFLQHGINGVLYRTGEHVLITVNEITQQVIRATDYFTACINGEYQSFVKGILYDVTDDVHSYSSSP